jgi:hypothetical protein
LKVLNKYSFAAPCGINCSICTAYLREKNKCPGCRGIDGSKPVTRINCKIKTCPNFEKSKAKFCFNCKDFPCSILEHLDKRYRTKYHVSPIDNLIQIKKSGIRKFLICEKLKWTCSCGGTVCVHKGYCYSCGKLKIY